MSKNSNETWQTKYGKRRVREEKPTLAEAIVAAQGLTDNLDEQADFAASLMGLPVDEVRAELAKLAPPRKDAVKSVVFTGSPAAPRTIVVERKISRRVIPSANRPTRTVAG
jgi:hypothetical protein